MKTDTDGAGADGGVVFSRPALPAGFPLTNKESGRCYRILSVLGSGGFGITYEAVSPEGRRVAVKEFFPVGVTARNSANAITVIGDEKTIRERLQSFFKETTILSKLKGLPSVVEIYEIFYANQTAYYVMEYIDGITMLRFLREKGLMNPGYWNPQFQKIMQTLEVLHDHGVIHRDISPDNIMIRHDGSFKLIDFGSARQFSGDRNLTVSVKRNFAPLEQYSEHGQGPYTDVYSLAATMYYAFTGKLVPLGSENRNEVPQNLLQAGVTPRQVESICRALREKISERYQTMEEFEAAYFDITRTTTISTGGGGVRKSAAASRSARSFEMLMKRPVFAAAAGACFVLAVILQLLL